MNHLHTNIYERLRYIDVMKKKDTYDTFNEIDHGPYIPYDIFLLIWNQILPEDRVIYEAEDTEFLYDDVVVKGSRKYSKTKKQKTKIRKAVRYHNYFSEFYDI